MEIRILRFNLTQRSLHWLHALSFLALLGTGLILYLPALSSLVGHKLLLRHIHLLSAVTYLLGPVLIARLGNWESIRAEAIEVDQWEPVDFRWLRSLGRKADEEMGRFNAGQKLNAIFTGGVGLLFVVSGLIMWQNPRFPRWLTQNAILLHDGLSWLALAVFVAHLYFAAVHPSTRPALRGMALGWVNGDWAREHHPKWYKELTAGSTTREDQGKG